MMVVKECENGLLISDIMRFPCDAVLVPMGLNNSMSNGFKHEISINFPIVKDGDAMTPYGDKRKLGTVVNVNYPFTTFCLCYVTEKNFSKETDKCSLNYDALKKCLIYVNDKFKGKKILTPILGESLFDGNGDKEKILNIINETCKDTDVIVYDFDQVDFYEYIANKIGETKSKFKNGDIDRKTYDELRSKIDWESKHGKINKMPDNYSYKKK